MKTIWRQPLFHFLIAGAMIFALNALRGAPAAFQQDRIIVTVAQIGRLAGLWQDTWGKLPTDQELQALVRDHVKEEVYYREAVKLGLNINDTVIRRRLRQKMEFLTHSAIVTGPPDEGALQSYFHNNIDQYRISPVYDFEQVYFSVGDPVAVSDSLALLRSGGSPDGAGEPISLPWTMKDAGELEVARVFGPNFYVALGDLQEGEWFGPVESGFGLHLVRINRKIPMRFPPLHEVRRIVADAWIAEQRAAEQESAYLALRAGYTIDFEALDN